MASIPLPTLSNSGDQTEIRKSISAIQDALDEDASGVPSGVVLPFAGSTAPSGYLICDGSAVSRKTYIGLYRAIGTAYGSGDGKSTFNLPDLRASMPRGVGTSEKYTQNSSVSLAQVGDDEFQGFWITVNVRSESHTRASGGDGSYWDGVSTASRPPIENTTDGYGTPRVGKETTGKFIGMNYIIKT